MAVIETWYNQDLQAPVQVQYLDGNVFSQDNLGNLIGVHVFDDGEPAVLSGTVSGNVIRADGGTVAVTGSLTGNDCYIILPAAAYAIPGPISIIIKLSGGGSDTTLCAVVANVYQASTDTPVDPGTIIPSIQDLIAQIQAAVATIPVDYSSLSSAVKWSLGETYPPYDVMSVKEAYVETSVSGKLDGGGYWVSDSDYIIRKIPVTPGELILVKAGSYYNTWQFMNSSYIPSAPTVDSKIFGQPARYNNQDIYIVVPNGAKYLMIVDTANSNEKYVYRCGCNYSILQGNVVISCNNLVSGSYSGNVDSWVYSFERLRTVAPVCIGQGNMINGKVPEGFTVVLCFFSASGGALSEYSVTGEFYYMPPVNAYYFMPVVKKTNNGTISPADVAGIVVTVKKGFNQLKSDVGNLCAPIVGERKYIDLTGLEEVSPSGQWDRTGMFSVKPNTSYLASAFSRKGKVPYNVYLAFYDESKRFIQSSQLADNSTFTTPSDCYYMIVSGALADIEYLYVSESGVIPMVYKRKGYNGIVGQYHNDNVLPSCISYAKNGLNYYGQYAVPIYPHGSKYAFIGAKYTGFDAVLIDVIMTTDGKFVVSHSDDLSDIAKNDDGTPLGTFKISEHTLSEVKAVDMGYDYGERYRHTRIQTLEEILAVVKSLRMGVIIEPELDPIGVENYTALANIVKSYGFTSDCIMFSYVKTELEAAQGVIPGVGLMLYCGSSVQTDQKITDAISLVGNGNKVYINAFANTSGTYTNPLTQTQIETMVSSDVLYCVSTPDSEPDGLVNFMANAPLAWYASLFGTVAFPASQILLENVAPGLSE